MRRPHVRTATDDGGVLRERFRGAHARGGPPPPSGACCVATAAGGVECVILSERECLSRHGIFRGANTTCTGDTCQPPPATGACCVELNGQISCVVMTARACEAAHGQY